MAVISAGLRASQTVLSHFNYPSLLSQRGPLTNYTALLCKDWPVIARGGECFSIAIVAPCARLRLYIAHPCLPLRLVPGDSLTQTAFCHVSLAPQSGVRSCIQTMDNSSSSKDELGLMIIHPPLFSSSSLHPWSSKQ